MTPQSQTCCAFFMVLTLVAYMITFFIWAGDSFLTCNYYEPHAVVENVKQLHLVDTDRDCEYYVAWRPLRMPWYSFVSHRSKDITRASLKLPCPVNLGYKNDDHTITKMEGCYSNAAWSERQTPRFRHYHDSLINRDVVGIMGHRVMSYCLATPLVLIVAVIVYTYAVACFYDRLKKRNNNKVGAATEFSHAHSHAHKDKDKDKDNKEESDPPCKTTMNRKDGYVLCTGLDDDKDVP